MKFLWWRWLFRHGRCSIVWNNIVIFIAFKEHQFSLPSPLRLILSFVRWFILLRSFINEMNFFYHFFDNLIQMGANFQLWMFISRQFNEEASSRMHLVQAGIISMDNSVPCEAVGQTVYIHSHNGSITIFSGVHHIPESKNLISRNLRFRRVHFQDRKRLFRVLKVLILSSRLKKTISIPNEYPFTPCS